MLVQNTRREFLFYSDEKYSRTKDDVRGKVLKLPVGLGFSYYGANILDID